MTITYHNKFIDWLAFQAYCVPRNPITILTSAGFFLFVTSQIVLPAIHSVPAGVPLFACILGFIFVELLLIAFILGFLAFITILPMLFPVNKQMYCERKLTTGTGTFFMESEFSRSETKWSVVQKLVRTPSYIFMFMGQHSALVVPRRAFEEQKEWEEFYAECKENQFESAKA